MLARLEKFDCLGVAEGSRPILPSLFRGQVRSGSRPVRDSEGKNEFSLPGMAFGAIDGTCLTRASRDRHA